MRFTKIVDDLINLSWTRATRGNVGSINVSQVRSVIEEMQNALGVDSLLKENEIGYLEDLMSTKKSLQIKKDEFKGFLLTLVSCDDFEDLFQKRFGLKESDISRRLDIPIVNSGGIREDHVRPVVVKSQYSPTSNKISGRMTHGIKQKTIAELQQEVLELKEKNLRQETKIAFLESQVSERNNSETYLESRLSKIAGEKLKCRDREIERLKKMCLDKEKTISEYQRRESEVIYEIDQTNKLLQDQKELIQKLQEGLSEQIEEDDYSRIKQFIMNLPILNQYKIFLKYKHGIKSSKVFYLNVAALIATALIIALAFGQMFYWAMRILSGRTVMLGYYYPERWSLTGTLNGFWIWLRLLVAEIFG
ncbi:uncharacterized protein J8A68_005431 [[Candida] subhashii]|uniref:Uncharacterized protein n=1 Tax=[Candida] subhashii TaxID=561895 RepID=A0A8J5QFE2_9ASCO|nr:uncharacterized protein J8A68_005431 [[Candida] subhashii]KAG7661059.1 hypothetical protein J8A68_005431 [[Candida] subhashii]